MKWDLNFLKTDRRHAGVRAFALSRWVPMRSLAVCGLASMLVLSYSIVGDSQVAAAVRLCKSVVTSSAFTSADEVDARRRALADWMQRSVAKGVEHPAWRIAYPRTMRCTESGGEFTCVARAAPCTISQTVPKTRKSPDDLDL